MVTFSTLKYEKDLWGRGYEFVCGVDEVGRGAWAGPLVAAAVIFPKDIKTELLLADSKKLTPKKREELALVIKKEALCFSYGVSDHEEINKDGISKATENSMKRAVDSLSYAPDFHLIDYFTVSSINSLAQRAVKGGDGLCSSIAAASILAKVYRDELMSKFDQVYTGFDFSKHKGYGTREHQQAIRVQGLTPIHRVNFVPVRLLS